MKKKIIYRTFTLILVFVVIFSTPALSLSAHARYSDYIDSYLAYLYSPNSSTAQIWFELKANYTSDKVGVTSITLQVSDDKVNWDNVGTYKDDDYPHLMASDTISICTNLEKTVESGHYYRAGLVFYVERDGGYDTRFYTTAPLWI